MGNDKAVKPFVSDLEHDGEFLRTKGHQPFYDGIVAELRTWNTPLEGYQAKDRADYIVRAVNSHEMLLEACKEALPCCINGSEQSLGYAIKILEQAIATATK